MLTFFGELPMFKMIEDYLPSQKGKVIELKEHQQEAMNSLRKMREEGQSIALLYHATGERVIIVTGCNKCFKSRISGALNNYISCIA